VICFAKEGCSSNCGPDGCAQQPRGCQSRHATATDVTPRMKGNSPVFGADGKVIIDRHPLRCWHGEGHEGKHGYGPVTWDDSQ